MCQVSLNILNSTCLLIFIVATSTAVEHVFSQDRHLLHFTCNHFLPCSVQAMICFGDWSRKDLVDNANIVQALSGKGKRKQEVIEIDDDDDDEIIYLGL